MVSELRSTAWGELLEQQGDGDFAWGYFGGLVDAATGLIYVGGGQYYDPATGRFLTRQTQPGNPNPYTPWGWGPIGAMLGPLSLLVLLRHGKKSGKYDRIILGLVLLFAVGTGLAACEGAGSDQVATTVTVETRTQPLKAEPAQRTPMPRATKTEVFPTATNAFLGTPTGTCTPAGILALTPTFTPSATLTPTSTPVEKPTLEPPSGMEWVNLTPNGEGAVSWYDFPEVNDPDVNDPAELDDQSYYTRQGSVRLNGEVYNLISNKWVKNDWVYNECNPPFASSRQCVIPLQYRSSTKLTTGAVSAGGKIHLGPSAVVYIKVPDGDPPFKGRAGCKYAR